MNKLIDINDVSTYPKKMTKLFDTDEDINADDVLSGYDFKCCHVCNTYDIENYYKFGIMRPFIVDHNNRPEINTILKDIILKPIAHMKDYNTYYSAYDKLLYDEYEEKKVLVDDWFGKYSCVCYTMDCMPSINIDNPAYEPVINCYGGELFRDIGFSDKEAESIAKDDKAYALFFRLSYDEIKKSKTIYMPDLIQYMKNKYLNIEATCWTEGHINKDISPTDFIEVKEIDR